MDYKKYSQFTNVCRTAATLKRRRFSVLCQVEYPVSSINSLPHCHCVSLSLSLSLSLQRERQRERQTERETERESESDSLSLERDRLERERERERVYKLLKCETGCERQPKNLINAPITSSGTQI